MGESHYDVLGVSPHAEDVVIEGAYKALLKRYHPDLHQGDTTTATARTAKLNEAYRVLKDSDARARYDRDQAVYTAKPPPRDADPRQEHSAPRPPPPRRAEPWSPAAAVAPPIPPASGRAKVVSAAYAALAALVLTAGVGSFISRADAPASTPPPSVETSMATKPARKIASRAKVATPAAATTFTTSFDCAKADSAVLTTICTNADLAKADQEMAARYKALLTTADPPDELRAAQQQWLNQRDASPAEPEALLRLYQNRLLELGSDQAIAEQLY